MKPIFEEFSSRLVENNGLNNDEHEFSKNKFVKMVSNLFMFDSLGGFFLMPL